VCWWKDPTLPSPKLFKGPRVFDAAGIPLHSDNQTIVKERIYQDKADPDVLYDEITTVGHALTRPWSVTRKMGRVMVEQPVWNEAVCAEGNNHVGIGGETYFMSGDGYLMPTRKGQAPPTCGTSSNRSIEGRAGAPATAVQIRTAAALLPQWNTLRRSAISSAGIATRVRKMCQRPLDWFALAMDCNGK
jgi:hypothetical protein